MSAGPQLGLTLYSLTHEYRAGRYTFEELLRRAGELKVGPPVELVGYQSIRGYPAIDDAFAARFRRLVDAAGLTPSCLGANVDVGRRRDRNMTDEEAVETLSAQIAAAEKLGFPVMRIQFGARPHALRRIAPIAERAGVRLGMEIHAPHHVDHPTVVAVRELYDEIDSPFLGFIPDFGASVAAIPAGALAQQRELGTPEPVLDSIVYTWEQVRSGAADAFGARRRLLADVAAATAPGSEAVGFAWRALTLWGTQPPAKWAEIMPRVVHVHAKFFDIDDRGDEPSVPYAELMRVFGEAGYTGTMSSEWEGSMWAPDADGFAMVKAHQELLRRHLAAAEQEVAR
jgi:sugar phosphate isomerase/epimerase